MNELFSLEGRIAIVTGSAQGLGYTIARGMLDAGAKVVLSDVSAAPLMLAQATLRAEGYEAPAYVFDISDERAVTEAVSAIEREVGPIHILVNNAGIHRRNPLIEMP
ncbi:MAG: SDR family NAD(P)-dependent oxidoreductase, partial [Eubacteriales bacterium]